MLRSRLLMVALLATALVGCASVAAPEPCSGPINDTAAICAAQLAGRYAVPTVAGADTLRLEHVGLTNVRTWRWVSTDTLAAGPLVLSGRWVEARDGDGWAAVLGGSVPLWSAGPGQPAAALERLVPIGDGLCQADFMEGSGCRYPWSRVG